MQYPLLFPKGTNGWSLAFKGTATLNEYLTYHLMIRDNERPILHHCRRLFQQYVIDMFCKLEFSQMKYIEHNQGAIRSDLYQGVNDALTTGDMDMSLVGRQIILPSSMTESPRYMNSHYQDAMALVTKFGKPTFLSL